MTSLQNRMLVRQRKERNQRIIWLIQDALGLLCILIVVLGLLTSLYLLSNS